MSKRYFLKETTKAFNSYIFGVEMFFFMIVCFISILRNLLYSAGLYNFGDELAFIMYGFAIPIAVIAVVRRIKSEEWLVYKISDYKMGDVFMNTYTLEDIEKGVEDVDERMKVWREKYD